MRAEARRQLKQDRFSRTTLQVAEQTVHWSAEHKGKVIGGVVVLAVIVAAGVGGWYYTERQDEKASVDFTKAVQTLNTPLRPAGMPALPENPSFASESERATEAHKQFQAIADKYPHTHAADYAHYFLGVTSASLGDNVAAERDLKEVADYHNSDLSSLAKMALASVYRNTGRSKDAIDIYKQLMQKPTSTVGKGSAEMALAEAYESAGMTADAKKEYQQLQKENPTGAASQLAGEKLQEIK